MKKQKLFLPKRVSETLAKFAIPQVLLILARDQILKEEHLNDPRAIIQLILKHDRTAIQKMKVCWSIDQEFLNEAVVFWKRKKKNIAIVLFACAVEQFVNAMYQIILEAKMMPPEASTQLIRSLNMDAKLGWMFQSFVGHVFPKQLGKRLLKIFEIRNAIVHFKAIPGRLDYYEDSGSKLNEALKNLRHMSLSRDFGLLEIAFGDAVLKTDSSRALALKAVRSVNELFEATKKSRVK